MVRVPKGGEQESVGNAIHRKNFQRIASRQKSVAVKRNEQYRTYTDKLPAHKQHLKVTAKNYERQSDKEEQDGTIKSLKTLFAVHVKLTEDKNECGHYCSHPKKYCGEPVEV